MTYAIILREYGEPENLRFEEHSPGPVGPGQILLRQSAVGVNFVDTYWRRGIYPVDLPTIIGDQAVGVVEGVGKDVTGIAVGDRVAYSSAFGSYTEARVIAASAVVKFPDSIAGDVIAATLTRGLTAEYLLFRLHALRPEETVIIYAAAGGTGSMMCQWARHIGATVIGTVGSTEKIAMAEDAGCDLVLLHDAPDFIERVRELTAGRMADVVYDSVGKDTFDQSLRCLRPRGLMVAFGNASGKPDPLDVLSLTAHGSLFLTRPKLTDYVGARADLELSSGRFFEALGAGVLRPLPVKAFALADAPAAHRHLQDRHQTSIPILVP